MTDKESKLIERLLQGDMEAYDELMPNARPEDRANFEDAIKKAREIGGEQDPISRAWLIFVLYLIGRHCDYPRSTSENVYPKPDNFWGDKFLEGLSKG